jgi:hypothetical protein
MLLLNCPPLNALLTNICYPQAAIAREATICGGGPKVLVLAGTLRWDPKLRLVWAEFIRWYVESSAD